MEQHSALSSRSLAVKCIHQGGSASMHGISGHFSKASCSRTFRMKPGRILAPTEPTFEAFTAEEWEQERCLHSLEPYRPTTVSHLLLFKCTAWATEVPSTLCPPLPTNTEAAAPELKLCTCRPSFPTFLIFSDFCHRLCHFIPWTCLHVFFPTKLFAPNQEHINHFSVTRTK